MWIKNLLDVCGKELRKTVSDVGVLVFFIVVPLLYPLLYAYLYGREVVREVPVVAVDDCRSTTSREFLRKSDATPDLKIISYCSDMEEARNLLHRHKAYGVIYIPPELDRTLEEGRQATINLYCDMSGLLYYKAMLSGCTMVSLEMNRDIQMVRLSGMSDREKEVMTMPIGNEYVTMFNPTNGFQGFLIPAVLILVLQQTLVLGVAMMAGTEHERRRRGELVLGEEYSNPITVLGGKGLAYLLVYGFTATYVLCVVPWLFHMPQLWKLPTLVAFIVPFLLASIFFAISISFFVRDRESCFLLFVFVSVPLIFMSGISWPTSNMPAFWKVFAQIFPSTQGVNGFARINTSGALLQDVRYELIALWIQAAAYFMTSLFIYERLYRSDKMPGVEFVLAMRARARRNVRVAVRDIRNDIEEAAERILEHRKK
ncbi:MAG: ABC transporter permease [Bacteroidaceae bacterium]|nr:ABC transporter permease [Bacteroidaceae bacterium]MBO7589260.1 ABC transporter permease [Bacteroidaceae bacterium]MBP5647531.1 ABC transporter permease [Bacteroidaceae bacterium]